MKRPERIQAARAHLAKRKKLVKIDAWDFARRFGIKFTDAENLLRRRQLETGEIKITDLPPWVRRGLVDPDNLDLHAIAAGPIMDPNMLYLPAGSSAWMRRAGVSRKPFWSSAVVDLAPTPTLFAAQSRLAAAYGLTREEVHNALQWARAAKMAANGRPQPAPAIAEPARLIPKPQSRRAAWDYGRIPEPNDGKRYCEQCDNRVSCADAARCHSRLCKAKGLDFPAAQPNEARL